MARRPAGTREWLVVGGTLTSMALLLGGPLVVLIERCLCRHLKTSRPEANLIADVSRRRISMNNGSQGDLVGVLCPEQDTGIAETVWCWQLATRQSKSSGHNM